MSAARHSIRAGCALAGLLLSLLMGCAKSPAPARQISVVLRYDDYSAKSPLELEARLFDVFRRHGLTLTVGVIPMVSADEMSDPTPQALLPLSQEKAAVLRQASADGCIEIGLHGYSHQTHRDTPLSEFAGLPLERQRERLALGRAALQEALGAPVTLFIPPWNTYDRVTLKALEELGFDTLSGQVWGGLTANGTLSYVPFTCYPADLEATLQAARASGDPAPVVVVLFHSYDLIEANPYRGVVSLDGLSELLRWLRGQADVRVLSVGQAAASISLDAAHLQLNRRGVAWSDLSPPGWQVQVADRTFLASTPIVMHRARSRALGYYAALLASSVAMTAFLARGLLPMRPRLWVLVAAVCVGGALLVTAYAVHDLRLTWRGMTAAALAWGAGAGVWLSWARWRRAR